MVTCPQCEAATREVSVPANPGTRIILDQCSRCGGIWCDQWELYPTDPAEAEHLDPVDEKLLNAPPDRERKTLYCPRCKDRLQLFRDPFLPPEVRLQRCGRCQGIWLKRGQFRTYKRFQKKQRAKNLSREDRIQTLARATSDPASWVTTGTRGIFAYPAGESETDNWTFRTASDAAQLILQTLLRLILGA